MRLVPSTVTRELSVQVVVPIDGPNEVSVAMRYDTVDPYAVHAVFRVADDQQVAWVFSRELLTEGLDQPSGDGDVRIWPESLQGRDVICISLRSPDGEALLRAPAEALIEFLSSAYALCPRGNERGHLKIDRALKALFAR